MTTHKNLDVWKKSLDLVDTIYDITAKFPKEEIYGLTNQVRRSAISVPSNIAEGSARGSTKELMQFINISRGSLAELETQIIVARRRNYIGNSYYDSILKQIEDISKMLFRLKQILRNKK